MTVRGSSIVSRLGPALPPDVRHRIPGARLIRGVHSASGICGRGSLRRSHHRRENDEHVDGMAEQGRSRRYLLVTSVGALGVVYGDIGTSPLYALREAFVAADGLEVTRATVFGVLSLVFWSLIVIVTIKYLFVVMRADNGGEGGILALTTLVARRRAAVGRGAWWGLILLGLFGTALLYGDGAITPAISVLAAVEGLEVSAPSLSSFVIPIAVTILIALFAIQKRGTAAIGAVFGPIMAVWFSVLAVLGVVKIVATPEVMGAVSPWYAFRFVFDQPLLAFLATGAIFLVVTGSEALYADMGHFGAGPIRIGWLTLVLPALVLNYFGQGALLLESPAAVENPFFRMAPTWSLMPLVLLATMATIIASQALISGAFSLTSQATQLGYLPRVTVDHTSPREFGQVYVRSVNWILMAASVGLVVFFGSSTNLAAAYGVAVTTTMVITTVLLYVVMRDRWRWSPAARIALTCVFLAVDLAFFAANIVKIPSGGWFPLVVGALVFALMTTWSSGKRAVAAALRPGELPIERFVGSIVEHPQQRVPGTAVYLFATPGGTPPALLSNLRSNEVLHETVAIVSVITTDTPQVPKARRATIHEHGEGFHQVTLFFGFMERPDVPAALRDITTADFGFDPTDATYFVGKETIVVMGSGPHHWRERLFSLMHRNALSAEEHFALPLDQVIEIGSQLEI
jgi:KUP system potassium uptake protein